MVWKLIGTMDYGGGPPETDWLGGGLYWPDAISCSWWPRALKGASGLWSEPCGDDPQGDKARIIDAVVLVLVQ